VCVFVQNADRDMAVKDVCVCLQQGTCVLVCMQKRHKERERDISVSV